MHSHTQDTATSGRKEQLAAVTHPTASRAAADAVAVAPLSPADDTETLADTTEPVE
jgi:hypothetical protein